MLSHLRVLVLLVDVARGASTSMAERLCSSGQWGDVNSSGGLLEDGMDVDIFDVMDTLDLEEGLDPFGQSADAIDLSLGIGAAAPSAEHAPPQAAPQRASKEAMKIERSRARNRLAQARYRQKAKVRLGLL